MPCTLLAEEMGEVSHGSRGKEEVSDPTLVVIGVRENESNGES